MSLRVCARVVSPFLLKMDARVQVYFRPRPPDQGRDSDIVVDGKMVSVRGHETAYQFAGALRDTATQEETYRMLCGGMLHAVAGGYDMAVLFYGQTGTGKTHTATGTPEEEGVVPRALSDILGAKLDEPRVWITAFQIGADETGSERVTDLLREGPEHPRICLGQGNRSEVRPLHTVHVSSSAEARRVVERANRGRSTRATTYNKQSSRSHAIICVHVTHGTGVVRSSTVYFCDLAGSERYSATDSDVGHKEAIATNGALSALGQVVQAMAAGSQHPPFRRSRLTEALAGPFCTGYVRVMVHSRAGEPAATIATLNFGQSALSITTRPVPREHAENHAGLRAQIDRMEQERSALEARLSDAERRLEEREAEERRQTRLAPPVADCLESSEYEVAEDPVPNSNEEMRQILDRLEVMNAQLFNYVQLCERFEQENMRLRQELEACRVPAQKSRGGAAKK